MNILIEFLLLGAIAGACIAVFKVLRARTPHSTTYEYAVGLALVAAFLLFWVNGAVGIIGGENNDANLMYGGVLGVGLVGSLVARFQPHGMVCALFATALSQVLVAGIALSAGLGSTDPFWPRDILIATGFFAALWVGSALLFWKSAAREQCPASVVPES